MLIDRLRSAAVLITIAVVCLFVDARVSTQGTEGLTLIPLLLFFALGTTWDITSLLIQSGRSVWRAGCMIAVTCMCLAPAIPNIVNAVSDAANGAVDPYPAGCPIGRLGWVVTMAVASLFALLIREMWTYGLPSANDPQPSADTAASILKEADSIQDDGPSPGTDSSSHVDASPFSSSIDRTMRAAFVSMYIGLPMSLLFATRSLGSSVDPLWGLAALLTFIATTKSADAGAYFAGKALGRNKLIPRLSPGKTWEGAVGGVIASTLVAMACLHWLFPALLPGAGAPSIMWAFVLGPALSISGMVGDLAESMFKRDCGAKDSGNWLPGLGGVWDVTDSLIAAILPAFLCLAAAA